ncbi:MAG TPA: hypothetical protein VEY95_09965 [Azospirillaceae bacterium]|nr:hypothetical protein [Azospirillaceae bacterium]
MNQAAALRQAEAIADRFRNAPENVTTAIRQASAKTGVEFSYLMEKASVESGFRTDAKATTSSAGGLFQFVEGTWLDMLKSHGGKYGYEKEANAIVRRTDGTYTVPDAEMRARVMELRNDPRASSLLAAEYARENRDYLQSSTGGQVGATELYMAHFLGPQGATRFLNEMRKNPDGTAATVLPEAARANKSVFYSKDGQALSLKDIYNRFAARFGTDAGSGAVSAPPSAIAQVSADNGIARGPAKFGNLALPTPDATPYFTVMMLAQLGNPLDADKNPPAALQKNGDRRDDRKPNQAPRMVMPSIGT